MIILHGETQTRLPVKIFRNVVTLAAALLLYYFVPVRTDDNPLWHWILFIAALGILIYLIVQQLMKQLAAGSDPVSACGPC
jgi:NhaP-type Na+/H+ or K+/H+ antiporter